MNSYSYVRPLGPGARVALVAPSGPVRGASDLALAEANVRAFGWIPVVGSHALARDGYLAGTDAQRVGDLNEALRNDAVDAIWCIRGGYGLTRILDQIDYDALRRRPRPVVGYSDVTALHCAVGRECRIVTYHAPTAREEVTAFSRRSLSRALVDGVDPCGVARGARTVRGGVARGRLMGGNLALIAALCGTPYAPDLRDAILVLEDVNEPVYRIDRMLHQLLMAGALSETSAIALGQCTEGGDESTTTVATAGTAASAAAGARTLEIVLREVADSLNIPCVMGLPIGHVAEQWTIPLGAFATLDADALSLSVHLSTGD